MAVARCDAAISITKLRRAVPLLLAWCDDITDTEGANAVTSRHRFWHIFLNIFDIIYFTIACVAGHGAPRIPPASAERSMLQAAGGQTCENARGPPRSSRKYPAPLYSSIQRAGVSGCPSHHGSRRGPRPMRCADPPGRTLVRRADGTDELCGSAVRDRPDRVQLTVFWNGYAERLIGSIRRESVDHMIVLGEAHLRRVLNVCRAVGYRARRGWANRCRGGRSSRRRRRAFTGLIPQV